MTTPLGPAYASFHRMIVIARTARSPWSTMIYRNHGLRIVGHPYFVIRSNDKPANDDEKRA